MKVWLIRDPDSGRIAMQDRGFSDTDHPRGMGAKWQRRVGIVKDETWQALLRGELSALDQDDLHHGAWGKAT